uniref:Uncharacterized protein n=1 Tax=viral metagenome TaxID=1070528 RepID=A0A6C0AR16_9ZZZZ
MEDLEKGPKDLGLQRMLTSEYNAIADQERTADSRKKFEERLRADSDKSLTPKEAEQEFARGSPETREKKEREGMIEEDPKELRNEYFETKMEDWGKSEMGGKRRKTHRKRHHNKKTYKKHRKASRKHKKTSSKHTSKRCTKKYRK